MGAEKVLRSVLLSGRSRVRIAPGVPNKRAILRWLFCLPRQQMRTRREIPETSKIRDLGDEILLVGGIPLGNRAGCATSEQALYRLLRFLFRNQSVLMPLLLLFRKKSRSARLLGCKRPRNGSLSLPTFCGLCVQRNGYTKIFFIGDTQTKEPSYDGFFLPRQYFLYATRLAKAKCSCQ